MFFQQKSASLKPRCVMMTYVLNVLLTGISYIRYVFAVSINFNLFFWDLFQTWRTRKTKENFTLTESMTLYGIFDNR